MNELKLMLNKVDKLWFQVGMVFLLYMLIFSTIFNELYYGDEMTYLVGGALISKGYVYYKDFADNKLPGIYLFTALLEVLFRQNYILLRAITFVITVFSSYVFMKITNGSGIRDNIRFWIGFLILSITMVFPFLFTETIAIPFMLLGIYLYKRKPEIAGFMFGISGFFRTTVYLYFGVLFILIFVLENKEKSLRMLKGFLFFIFLLLLYLKLQQIDVEMLIKSNSGFLGTTFDYFVNHLSNKERYSYFLIRGGFFAVVLWLINKTFRYLNNFEKCIALLLPFIAIMSMLLGVMMGTHYLSIFSIISGVLLVKKWVHVKKFFLEPGAGISILLIYTLLIISQNIVELSKAYEEKLRYDFLEVALKEKLEDCNGVMSIELLLRQRFGKYTLFKALIPIDHYYKSLYDKGDVMNFLKNKGCFVEVFNYSYMCGEENEEVFDYHYEGKPYRLYIYRIKDNKGR